MFSRFLKHSFTTGFKLKRIFPKSTLSKITEAVRQSELHHRGEIRVCIESSLNPIQILRGVSGRDRAVDMFSLLRVWDTEENNGVLIYILIADHDIEIVADRGVVKNSDPDFWQNICGKIENQFRNNNYEEGILQAVHHIGALLKEKYPLNPNQNDINELPDHPHIIK